MQCLIFLISLAPNDYGSLPYHAGMSRLCAPYTMQRGFRRNSARRDADECYESYRLTSSPELLRRKSRPITFIRSRMNCRGDVILRQNHDRTIMILLHRKNMKYFFNFKIFVVAKPRQRMLLPLGA